MTCTHTHIHTVCAHTKTSTHPDDKLAVYSFEKSFVFLCLTFSTKPTLTPTNPSSVFPRQQLYHGQSSHSYKCDSCAVCNLFSSARRNRRERNHNGFTRPWEKEYIQTWKNVIFLHTSVVPSSPGWLRQEMGMTASCPSRLWRQAARGRCHGGAMFLRFHQALCNVWFTASLPLFHLWFSVSRSDGYRLPYMSALFLQDSKWKKSDTGEHQATIRTLHNSV